LGCNHIGGNNPIHPLLYHSNVRIRIGSRVRAREPRWKQNFSDLLLAVQSHVVNADFLGGALCVACIDPQWRGPALPNGTTIQSAMSFEEMTLGGEVIHLIHGRVPLDGVDYDENNPRLRYLSEMNGGMTPEQLLSEIPDAPKLRKDIELAGDLRERVILRPLPTGKFKSVEGNRRRHAFGELHRKYPDDTRWQSMPARILPENIDERKVALLF
jgi:hypothetical protein